MALPTAIAVGSKVAEFLPTHRQCSVEVKNKCSYYDLCNPGVYSQSGSCAQSLPLTLDPSSSGNALFTKTPHAARGAVGVFTYDLHNKSTNKSTKKIAVMFSVPYDFNLYSNWYAVGIFDKRTQCNYDLYCEMYHNSENSFVRDKASGSCLKYKNNGVTVVASMTDSYQPVMKVEVKDV